MRLVVAVTASWLVSLFGYYAQTQMLGPLMRGFQQGEETVAWLFSLENTLLAVSALAFAGPLARWSRAHTALAGGAIVVTGNILSAMAGSFETLTVIRALTGIGAGAVGASGTAAAASSRVPDRVFAAAMFSWGLTGAAEPMALPYATVPFGSSGGFLLIAGACMLALPALRWLLPPHASDEEKPSLRSAPHRSLAAVALSGLLIYEIGQGGIWTFVEQIGLRSGLDEYRIGATLTGTAVVGLIGAAIAAGLGTRFGRRLPIIVGLSLNILAAVGLATSDDPTTFVAMNWLWNLAYYFVVPYLLGAMSALDDLGRWAVASDAMWTLGDGLGPGIAGSLVARAGYDYLAGFGTATGLAAMLLIVLVLSRLAAEGRSEPDEEPA